MTKTSSFSPGNNYCTRISAFTVAAAESHLSDYPSCTVRVCTGYMWSLRDDLLDVDNSWPPPHFSYREIACDYARWPAVLFFNYARVIMYFFFVPLSNACFEKILITLYRIGVRVLVYSCEEGCKLTCDKEKYLIEESVILLDFYDLLLYHASFIETLDRHQIQKSLRVTNLVCTEKTRKT